MKELKVEKMLSHIFIGSVLPCWCIMIHELHYSMTKQKITSCGLYWRECGLRKKYEVNEDEHQDTDPSNFFQKGAMIIRKTSRAGKNYIIEGVCYNPLDQEEQADEAYGQVGGASHSQVLLLCFALGTSATMVSAGGITWQDISSQGGSWSV